MTDLFERVVLPVADPDDARATARALGNYEVASVVALHVIEKGGGVPDKASVEQREEYAADVFRAVEEALPPGIPLETDLAFGTDVAETIFEVADEYDASAIVFSPRGGSRWVRLLTGDVALSLVTESDRPVVVLPDSVDEADDAADSASEADDAADSASEADDAADTVGEADDAADTVGEADDAADTSNSETQDSGDDG